MSSSQLRSLHTLICLQGIFQVSEFHTIYTQKRLSLSKDKTSQHLHCSAGSGDILNAYREFNSIPRETSGALDDRSPRPILPLAVDSSIQLAQ